MAKYTVPGIRFTEIDNTIRTESEPGMGIGAIVMKSNKGPVNQRVVTKNYGEFTEIFGEPETLTDYGHFAAENYFANSNQLFAVRATMGDEQYSQIQFSYQGAPVTATNSSKDTAKFVYVDSEGDNNLVLLQPLSAVTIVESMISGGDWRYDGGNQDDGGQFGFALKQNAYYNKFRVCLFRRPVGRQTKSVPQIIIRVLILQISKKSRSSVAVAVFAAVLPIL